MVTLLLPFEHLFDPRTWRKAQLLAMGAILSPGKRTVSSALNILGIGQHGDFAVYHQVLNRARWSPLQLSRALLLLVVGRLGSSTEPLVFGIDETVERRWGRKIAAQGRYRDPVRSRDDQVVMTPGLQWVSLMLLTRIGWAGRHWALPFLTALVVSARYDRRKGRRHKTVTDYAQQMLVCLRRWLPERDLVVVADGGYAKREFLRHCQNMSKPIVVVTKLRKDASLYQPAPPRRPGQIGRPRVVGARLPSPTAVLDDPATQWTPYRMDPLPHGPPTAWTPYRMDPLPHGPPTAWTPYRMDPLPCHRVRRQYRHGRARFGRGTVVPRRAAAPSHTLGRRQIPGGAPRALCFAMHRHRGGTAADIAVVSAAVAGRGDL